MLRYLRHLHLGRIDPRTIGFRLNVPAKGHDFAALLRSALADDRIAETVAALRPPLVQYNALRTMLRRYRSLAADVSLGSLPAPAADAGAVERPRGAGGDRPVARRRPGGAAQPSLAGAGPRAASTAASTAGVSSSHG